MPEIIAYGKDDTELNKEIFNKKDIELKTELEASQVNAITKMKMYGFITGNKLISQFANDFMILQKSKERKSMSEYLDSIGRKQDLLKEQQKNNMVNNMLG